MANKKATRQEIEDIANRVGGCVAAVAEAIGVSRQALYERGRRLGIDWGVYRERAHTFASDGMKTITTVGAGPVALSVTRVSRPEGDDGLNTEVKLPDPSCDPSLHGMERGAAAQVVPIARRRVQQPPRFLPEQADAVADFRIRYQPKLGYETNNSALFQQFFAECWPQWAEKKMAEGK